MDLEYRRDDLFRRWDRWRYFGARTGSEGDIRFLADFAQVAVFAVWPHV
jgi:hypothetical protein